MGVSTIIIRTSPFQILGVTFGAIFHLFQNSNRTLCKQIMRGESDRSQAALLPMSHKRKLSSYGPSQTAILSYLVGKRPKLCVFELRLRLRTRLRSRCSCSLGTNSDILCCSFQKDGPVIFGLLAG